MSEEQRTVLVAHPSPDLYGSDLQLLETVTGFVDAGWRVVVTIPHEGPLLPLLAERGADILVIPFPFFGRHSYIPGESLAFFGTQSTLRSVPVGFYARCVRASYGSIL